MQLRRLAMPVSFHARQTLGALFLLVTISFATPLWAQKDAGAIVGLVRDSTGAVVAGAKITVLDVDHGTQTTLATNDQGEYVASPLRIGRYKVTAEKEGFKKAVAGPIQVNIQDRVGVDLKLEPGMATEVVTVTSQRPELETENSELGNLVDSHSINSLPLNGRNFMQLALLGAGVTTSEPGSRVENSYGFSANGGRSLQNNFLLDGVDNNANLGDVLNGSSYVVQPPVDAIAEFKVQTNAYSAEFGRGNGAIMNAVIKSGTNQLHGDLWEFVRNDKFDSNNYFDDTEEPYKQNQFGFTLGGPIVKNKLFFFGDYEGLRIRQAEPQLVIVPTTAEVGGDFSALLTTTPAIAIDANGNSTGQTALDCNGNPTYMGEIFNSRQAQTVPISAQYPDGFCGVPIGTTSAGAPTNIFQGNSGTNTPIDALAARLAALLPSPNTNVATLFAAGNFRSDPERSDTNNKFDVRGDYTIGNKDNFFARYSYGRDNNYLPAPFNNALDGGSFGDGYALNISEGLAASEIHTFRSNLINELRFGFNHLNSHRFNPNYNVNESATLGIPGVPFQAGQDIGGLPNFTFTDGTATLGSSEFLPAIEKQHSYVFTDNLSWIHGRHAVKFGGELRFEQFTINEPAAARGGMSFGADFTDNPAAPGSNSSAFATFLLGVPDGGGINGLNNIIYNRQMYSGYALDDFKMSPRLTLNLGLRYEFVSTIKEANNLQANFDFNSLSLIVPKGQNTPLTPTLATELQVQDTGTPGLISPDLNNFAPRIGLSYQLSNKLVLRTGYGLFYGGQESGPFSNPSPGYNPPYSASQSYATPCSVASANSGQNQTDCSISGDVPLNVLSQGFSGPNGTVNPLADPNTPLLYSINPHLVTPYTQQWHLGVEYQLPADTVLEVSYGGSRGLKLYAFYNGNQVPPGDSNLSDPTAPRRPAHAVMPGAPAGDSCTLQAYYLNNGTYSCDPAFDASTENFRSNAQSNYDSLQVRLEKRYTHGLQYQLAYTWAHSLDTASSASLGSTNNGDFQDQRFPNANYGNSDFDVRHRFVFSYVYDLPMGRGQALGKDTSGVVNQVLGNWQLSGVVTLATGNYYTATDDVSVANGDCGGTVGGCTRPNLVGNPNAKPCIPGTIFNTCAFADDNTTPGIIPIGTLGNAPRNDILGPGTKEWDTSLVKQFPISEQKHLELRAEFFNVLNHVNYLFGTFGTINAPTTSVTMNSGVFGYPQASRAPRQIQFAVKFYF
jgi:hypothetical protein